MMRSTTCAVAIFLAVMFSTGTTHAQIDDLCAAAGYIPSMDPPFPPVPYVFGRVRVKGSNSGSKSPHVVVIFSDRQQPVSRQVIGGSGTYCFKRSSGSGGTMIVEVDGEEVTRRTLPTLGPAQQREDFEIDMQQVGPKAAPGVVSSKFTREPNEKTVELYKKAAKAEKSGDIDKTINYLKQIVAADPEDYPAWGKLGARYFEKQSIPEAEAAFKEAIRVNPQYTPAWLSIGLLRINQKQFEAAIGIFKQVTELDPSSAMAYRLLGISYLQTRQGTLGIDALDQAIKLDPVGMAECHLLKAHLYELAGYKKLAADEYKVFLTKVPDYKEKKRLEEFITANPN
ncbi:MAG TPA: tetratricopeptide repeat protein [Pyrinomonadaceae bacterium]|nr:tetratricopeptide repeat protein [Pyrinomonadaceae bacterium]